MKHVGRIQCGKSTDINHPEDAESLSPSTAAAGLSVRMGSTTKQSLLKQDFNWCNLVELTKVGLGLGFTCCQSLLMIIAKKFIEEINSLVRNITLIFRGNEASPRFSWISGPRSACLELPRRLVDRGRTFQEVHRIGNQAWCYICRCKNTTHRCLGLSWFWRVGHNCHVHGRRAPCEKSAVVSVRNPNKGSGTYHRSKHATIAPHVQTIVVFLKVHKEFGTFEVAGCHPNIILRFGMVEFSQAPVDETKLHDDEWSDENDPKNILLCDAHGLSSRCGVSHLDAWCLLNDSSQVPSKLLTSPTCAKVVGWYL